MSIAVEGTLSCYLRSPDRFRYKANICITPGSPQLLLGHRTQLLTRNSAPVIFEAAVTRPTLPAKPSKGSVSLPSCKESTLSPWAAALVLNFLLLSEVPDLLESGKIETHSLSIPKCDSNYISRDF